LILGMFMYCIFIYLILNLISKQRIAAVSN
jgi:hypothetical protein